MATRCKGEGAGQHEDLVDRLRGIIRDYPPGISIIKEFLQNSDDAGATWIRFTLDLRVYPTQDMPDDRMAALLGPALLIESNQVFSDKDLRNIQRIGSAGKLEEAAKTGRFGLGFNTSYNITDYPSFATREWIYCFDPHEDAVARDGKPGQKWKLAKLWREAPVWPRAFSLEEGVTLLDRTVFRLPLRTPAQASPLRICNSPFPPEDIESIFEEVALTGGSLLLFLHNILEVEARTIIEDGEEIQRVAIRTTNPEDVRRSRGRVHSACVGRIDDFVSHWSENQTRPSDIEAYEHFFATITPHEKRQEHWLVSQGLFTDGCRDLLDAAIRMSHIPEKALPLAGAAVALTDTAEGGIQIKPMCGQLFCTLPVQDASPFSFHINGYFDLDSSRNRLTHSDKPFRNEQIRTEWNIALLKHGVARAVDHLLKAVAERIDDRHLTGYYDLWPNPDRLAGSPHLAAFSTALYGRLARTTAISLRCGERRWWVSLEEARLPAKPWDAPLVKALLADGLTLPDPALPPHVIAGFASVKIKPKEWSASDIAGWLRPAMTVSCKLANAPRNCLREIAFVGQLLQFCARSVGLKGLPLGLTDDETLHLCGERLICLGDKNVREIYCERESWFIHKTFEDTIKEDKKAKLIRMDATLCILNLKTHLTPVVGHELPWLPSGENVPNEPWLVILMRWLRSQDVSPHWTELKKHALIPDQFDRLITPGHFLSPMLPEEATPQEIRGALTAFGVPLLTADVELKAEFRLLAKRAPGLIRPLSATDVVDALNEVAGHEWPGEKSPHLRHLLNWLAAAPQFDPQRSQKLKSLRLWPTQDGGLVSLAEGNPFLPTNYHPPAFLGKVTLLRTGPGDRWKGLLKGLGVHELRLKEYVETVFLPGYSNLNPTDQVAALAWLRDEWLRDAPKTERTDTNRPDLDLLKGAGLVRDVGGQNRPAGSLYHPRAEQTIELLDSIANVPDMEAYREGSDEWLRFFVDLGMHWSPTPQDLVRRVDQLAAMAGDHYNVDEQLLAVLDYLSNGWTAFSEPNKRDLRAELTRRKWLPAVLGGEPVKKLAGFKPPAEVRLYRPCELYPMHVGHLVASQAPLLASTTDVHADLRKALDMPTSPPLALVLAHFREVRGRWSSLNHNGLTADTVSRMARSTYRFFAQFTEDADALKELAETPCIWHERKFWKPDHVFACKIGFFGDLRAYIPIGGEEGKGLDLLGRRNEVLPSDYVAFLNDLGTHWDGMVISDYVMNQIFYAFGQIDPDSNATLLASGIFLLSHENKLVRASKLMLDDAPWWKDRLENIDWLHSRIDKKLALAARVHRATTTVTEILIRHTPSRDPAVRDLCARFERLIASPEFAEGVHRITACAPNGTEFDDAAISASLKLQIRPCSVLRTALVCDLFTSSDPVGESSVSCFLQPASSDPRVLIAAVDPEQVIHALATSLNRRLGDPPENLAHLEAILRCEPQQIQARLDQRRVPRVSGTSLETVYEWPDPPESSYSEQDGEEEELNAPQDNRIQEGTDDGQIEEVPVALRDEFSDSEHEPSGDSERVPGHGFLPSRPANFGRRQVADTNPHPSSDLIEEGPLILEAEDGVGIGFQLGTWAGRPMAPGRGRPGEADRARGRLRSYLISPSDPHGEAKRSAASPEVEVAAVEHVVRREEAAGHKVQRMHRTNEGYDLEVMAPGEADPRILEVKGLRHAWDQRGIALTPAEFLAAQRFGSRYWLVVVEYALEAEPKVVRIHNPANSVTEYRFDDGWRCVHEAAKPVAKPEKGMLISSIQDGVIGRIEGVTTYGMAVYVTVTGEGDQSSEFRFDPRKHVLSWQGGADGEDHPSGK
jgi:hypothetical protein